MVFPSFYGARFLTSVVMVSIPSQINPLNTFSSCSFKTRFNNIIFTVSSNRHGNMKSCVTCIQLASCQVQGIALILGASPSPADHTSGHKSLHHCSGTVLPLPGKGGNKCYLL
jgi:hypothetical protein